MRLKWDSVLTGTLVVCAVITTVVVVYRGFLATSTQASVPLSTKPEFIETWQADAAQGVQFSPAQAAVHIMEFADFECPFCASFHQTLKTIRQRYPGQISFTYVHLPLPGHRFAEPAAHVAECAGEQGRFEAMYDVLFEDQKSFGLKPWSDYARRAGLNDSAAFETCVRGTVDFARVAAGIQLAKKLDIQVTPTVIVNGWKLARPPTAEELESMVKAVLAGRSPLSAIDRK